MSENTTKRIAIVSTDAAFVQETRAAFASSEQIELRVIDKSVIELRGDLQENGMRSRDC